MNRTLVVALAVFGLTGALLTACAPAGQPSPTSTSALAATSTPDTPMPSFTPTVGPETTVTPTGEPEGHEDAYSELLAAFEAAGATVESTGSIEQPFFLASGQSFAVNGGMIQVFPYPSAEAAEVEAARVAPDGSSVGTSMISWMEAPHFFRQDRLIVLYVGDDPDVLTMLESVLGPQFAGA
jgi:hypothetical protein